MEYAPVRLEGHHIIGAWLALWFGVERAAMDDEVD
jgi:hypothetical protein